MRLKRLIKRFDFTSNVRSKITLGTGVRLDVVNHYLRLVDTNGVYSTDDDLYAKTWAANPNSVKQWLGFECVVDNFRDDNDATQIVTGVKFRLHDDANEYWYNGAAWVIDGTNWNTEEEVANNINTFIVSSKKIGVVVNLYTEDAAKTPVVKAIKVLYSSDVYHQDDYLYRTTVRQLKQQIRPITDYPVTMSTTSAMIDLKNDYPLETPYNIVSIDSVFNDTDDPDHFTDLFQSYDDVNQVITLSSSISVGKVAWVKFVYQPEVAVTTGLEYYELDKVPALVLTNVNLINTVELSQSDSVVNKATLEAVKVLPPKRNDMEITINVITDSARDQTRMADELKRFFANNTALTSWGIDEEFRLWLLDEYDGQVGIDSNGIQAGKLRFLLVGTLYYERDAVDVHAVGKFNITGDINVTV
jgi:hypothetical protein